MSSQGRRPRPVAPWIEGAATAIAGGALGASAGGLVGLSAAGGAIGALNGAVGGGRGIYRWSHPTGWAAFLLDSTWALPTTLAALAAHVAAATRPGRGGYVAALSRRQNRHVYTGGLRLRRGFVITIGNTINSAGDAVHTSDRRRRLISDHEEVHVWQARGFGPTYPVLYLSWSVLGALAGVVVWATRRRDEPVTRVVDTCAYYLNPFEWWAYSRDGLWPPPDAVGSIVWARPAVRPFRTVSATRRASGTGRR